jgi:hypothetical protein
MKTPRNKSLRYQDHAGLLHKWAKMFHARLAAAQINDATFDDVVGELGVAFTKAAQGYKPESGWTFTAFLQVCARNHFNKYASRLLHEQYGSDEAVDFNEAALQHRGLGCISVQDMRSPDGEDTDFYSSIEDDTFARPDEVVDASMTLKRLFSDPTLMPETRAYIALVVDPHMRVSEKVRDRIRRSAAAIRGEVQSRWGVELPCIRL